jgi:hypothetical protein
MYNELRDISLAVLKCAAAWEPEAKLIGNVSAREVLILAAFVVDQTNQPCPMCGSEPWVNIDCSLCNFCNEVFKGD